MSIVCRSLINNLIIKYRPIQGNVHYSKITFADSGKTIVAFHPEEKFPYELTRPLPEESVIEDKSVLKMNNIADVMKVFKDVNPEAARENLMKLTLTTKHRWFPCNRRLKRKIELPEKPYL